MLKERPSYDEERRLIHEDALKLPAEFGLRAFPGQRFRVNEGQSYWHEGREAIVLYLDIDSGFGSGDTWRAFSKDTIDVIAREVVRL
jgi:hypothetical protein